MSAKFQNSAQILLCLKMIDYRANTVNPDETAHYDKITSEKFQNSVQISLCWKYKDQKTNTVV